MSKDEIDPDASKVARIRQWNSTGIKAYVSDGTWKCGRCKQYIPKGESYTWVRGWGGYHIGSCPKPEQEN
jgi:hypothetical protein